LNEKKFGPEGADQIARAAEILLPLLGTYMDDALLLMHEWVERVMTQRCDNCNKVIAVHPGAYWRFVLHWIRCDTCAQELMSMDVNLTEFEAYYVE